MTLQDLMPKTLLRKAREYTRLLWVRVLIMGLMAFVALGLTQIFEPLVPEKLATSLTGEAADRLLQIIADAMLAVTIFSITVMVSVYRSSSIQWTPRIHRLIIQDHTTQNTMAVFIGAYVYALLAIILRELGIFVDNRAFVLFLMTCVVLGVIVVSLIRWVLHLQTFGSLIDTTRQIEDVAREQFRERLENPCLGAQALTGDLPDDSEPVRAKESGYIQHLYPEALNAAAKAHGYDVYLTRNIGDFVFLNEPLAVIVEHGEPEEQEQDFESIEAAIRRNIVLGDVRTYDQDPRFGLTVMGEVGSKALSPGVNDPGTAIDVITRIARILSDYKDETKVDRNEPLDRLFARPLVPADLIEDGFGALSRHGATDVEVQITLQGALGGLMRHPDAGLRKAAGDAAERELRRALGAMDFDADRARLKSHAHDDVVAAADAA